MTFRRILQLLFKNIKPLFKLKIILGVGLFIFLLNYLSTSSIFQDPKFRDEFTYEDEKFQAVTVHNIIDATSIEVMVGNELKTIRLISLQEPSDILNISEYNELAVAYMKDLVLNKSVYLEKDVNDTDRAGTLIRYVWLVKPENKIDNNIIRTNLLNSLIVRHGYADVITDYPNEKYEHVLIAEKMEAKEEGMGFWKEYE